MIRCCSLSATIGIVRFIGWFMFQNSSSTFRFDRPNISAFTKHRLILSFTILGKNLQQLLREEFVTIAHENPAVVHSKSSLRMPLLVKTAWLDNNLRHQRMPYREQVSEFKQSEYCSISNELNLAQDSFSAIDWIHPFLHTHYWWEVLSSFSVYRLQCRISAFEHRIDWVGILVLSS